MRCPCMAPVIGSDCNRPLKMILRDVKVLRLTAIAFLIDVDEVARNMAQGTKIIGYTQYTSTQREVR